MFSVYKGETRYFDESGDTGDVKNKSNTNFFDIALYTESTIEETEILAQKIRSEFGLKSYQIFKWNKFSKENKIKFKIFFEKNLMNNTCLIWCDKRNIDIFGEDLYRNMLFKLIKENNLKGKVKYDGDHLYKLADKVRVNLNIFGLKVHFENVETNINLGVQIADLCAGYLQWCLENKMDLNMKNIIKF